MPRRFRTLALSATAILTLTLVFAFSFGRPAPTQAADKNAERIALIYAEGVITGNAPQDSPFFTTSGITSVTMVQTLEKAQKDDKILAVVIRVNSPGGSAAASQEIYDAINRCKAEKPVYISMGDICASGGYYISAPATRIFATPATLVGSIGVIMELPRYDGLLKKIGVEMRTFKAGEHKDIGSGTRDMTPEEAAILQKLLTTTHAQFIEAVAEGRQASGKAELDETSITALADGTIWTGEDAVGVGLVDELAGLQETLVYAATQANLDPDDFIVDEMKKGFFDELMESFEVNARPSLNPLTHLGALAQRYAMLQAMQSMAASTPPMPQTAYSGMNLAESMYLCGPLAGGISLR